MMSYNELVNEKAHRAERGLKMMYSEFVQGTGCKDNEKNYEVFKNLEVMYMNSDMTKEQIYEYGKKLVDNSKSPEELENEAHVKAEIEIIKRDIDSEKTRIAWKQRLMEMSKSNGWKDDAKRYKEEIKAAQRRILVNRQRIAALKWVLG